MSSATASPVARFTSEQLAGKFLTFSLGHESYGFQVLKVREIIRMQEITRVPQMPEHTKGVVNLRGKIIPIMDLRIKFCLKNIRDTELTCIIVVQVASATGNTAQMGVIVDAVEEVVLIGAGEIENAPDFGKSNQQNYILGMAKVKGKVKTLLDIDTVMQADSIQLAHAA